MILASVSSVTVVSVGAAEGHDVVLSQVLTKTAVVIWTNGAATVSAGRAPGGALMAAGVGGLCIGAPLDAHSTTLSTHPQPSPDVPLHHDSPS